MNMSREQLAALFDHTLLKPDARAQDVETLCREAKEYGFYSVCVNPYYVSLATKCLADSSVQICTVVAFPLGAATTNQKQMEAKEAIDSGATEIDMVINLGALKSDNFEAVKNDIAAVQQVCQDKAKLKVILEIGLLNEKEIVRACVLAQEAGADFVKTSTGFISSGATVEAIELMRSTVGPKMGVKASGGIRTLEQVMKMIEAGANRIGASAGVKIIQEI